MDEELDCAGVQWQEFHAGWFRDDADIAKQTSLDKVNGPYSALQFADDGSHEEIASHTDAGAVERDKCCGGGGDAGLHVDEAMGVDHAVFDLELPGVTLKVERNGVDVHVAVEHDVLAAARAFHLVVEVGAARLIGDVYKICVDAAFREPCLEFSHGAGLMRGEALVLVEPSHELHDFCFVYMGVN